MKISLVMNHGKPRWRVNIQRGLYRKRLFFATREEAFAFAEATGGPVNHAPTTPRQFTPTQRP
jgi:hypothetical protein